MINSRHEGLRTRAHKLAAAATALHKVSGVIAPLSLVLMTDAKLLRNAATVIRAMPAGAAVIFRQYDDPRRQRNAMELRALCAARGIKFLLAGDIDLAEEISADGIHMPNWMLKDALQRPWERLVTAACHGPGDLERAADIGADAALLSPVYQTASHPGAKSLGARTFKAMAGSAMLPVLALGGVDETNATTLAGKNVAGFAAISAFRAR